MNAPHGRRFAPLHVTIDSPNWIMEVGYNQGRKEGPSLLLRIVQHLQPRGRRGTRTPDICLVRQHPAPCLTSGFSRIRRLTRAFLRHPTTACDRPVTARVTLACPVGVLRRTAQARWKILLLEYGKQSRECDAELLIVRLSTAEVAHHSSRHLLSQFRFFIPPAGVDEVVKGDWK